jgi:catechol 2,3-dioxygenase-like lactoylglutathione lyase family enzyme
MSKFYLLICLTFLTTVLPAQDTSIKPSFIALFVSDIDSSIEWYSKVLNLKQRNRTDNEARGFKQVILKGNHLMVELVQLKRALPSDDVLKNFPQGSTIEGFQKFGMTVKNLDTFHQRLEKLQVRFYGSIVADPIDNKRTFLVQDPDGNLIQFFEE